MPKQKYTPHSLIFITAVTKLQEFCKHCTLHGVYYFSKRHHWTVYAIWSCIIASSLALCVFLCHMIWQKFVVDPTFTVVESTHYSTSQIPFPAVTVCDTEKVYGPNTHNFTNILRQRSFNDQQIEAFYNSFSAIEQAEYTSPEYVKKMHKIMHDLGYNLDKLQKMLAKPCDVLMVACAWRSKIHNCTDMFRQVHTYLGYCCQFDMVYFKNHAGPDTDFVAGIEISESLNMVVNGEKVSFRGSVTDGYMQLYVYDDTTNFTIVDPATTISPAGFFDINIYLWAIDSSKDVKTLSIQNRKCILPTDILDSGRYYQECMTILIFRQVVNYCRCLPFRFTASQLQVEDYGKCSWERLNCVFRAIANVRRNIADIISQKECLERCDRVQYETEIEYIRQRTQLENNNENFSTIAVHFTSNTCFKYRREVLYAWDQMLANLGGIFGLCLGGSVISLIELVWFIIDFFLTVWTSAKKNKTGLRKKNLVFTISQQDFTSKLSKEKNGKYKFVN